MSFKRRGYNNNRSNSGGYRNNSYNRGPRQPREMHKATCSDCGNECEVPFVPHEGKPVYCKECFQNHRSY